MLKIALDRSAERAPSLFPDHLGAIDALTISVFSLGIRPRPSRGGDRARRRHAGAPFHQAKTLPHVISAELEIIAGVRMDAEAIRCLMIDPDSQTAIVA
jgi:hypothetical protein